MKMDVHDANDNERIRNFSERFFAVPWLGYTARNARILWSSVLLLTLTTELRRLRVVLHISSAPGLDSSTSCFWLSRLIDVNCESMSCPAFRCLTVPQSAHFFLRHCSSKVKYDTNLLDCMNTFFLSLYSDTEMSAERTSVATGTRLNCWTGAGTSQSVWGRAGQLDSWTAPRQALGPIGLLSNGTGGRVKRSGRDADLLPQSNTKVELCLHYPLGFDGMVRN
jgi:hypothetical protein